MTETDARVKWQEDFLNLKTIALSVKQRNNKKLYIAFDLNTVYNIQQETLKKVVSLFRKITHQHGVYVFLYTNYKSDEWVKWFFNYGVQFHSINKNTDIALPTEKPFYDILFDSNAGFKETYWHWLVDLIPLIIGFINDEYCFNDMIPMASAVTPKRTKRVRIEDINVSNYSKTASIVITDDDMEET